MRTAHQDDSDDTTHNRSAQIFKVQSSKLFFDISPAQPPMQVGLARTPSSKEPFSSKLHMEVLAKSRVYTNFKHNPTSFYRAARALKQAILTLKSHKNNQLQTSAGVVGYARNPLKFDFHSLFGPISLLEFGIFYLT